MSYPHDLLQQARDLAEKEPRKPRQSSLRRSVSSAYYALFHFIGDEATRLVLGTQPSRRLLRQTAMRSIAHTKLKDVCGEFLKATPRAVLQPLWTALIPNNDLHTICNAVRDSQQLRHQAEYDLTVPVTRVRALIACAQTQDAIEAWDRLKTTERELLYLFATVLLLWPGLAQR